MRAGDGLAASADPAKPTTTASIPTAIHPQTSFCVFIYDCLHGDSNSLQRKFCLGDFLPLGMRMSYPLERHRGAQGCRFCGLGGLGGMGRMPVGRQGSGAKPFKNSGKRPLKPGAKGAYSKAPARARAITKSTSGWQWKKPSQKLCPWPAGTMRLTNSPFPAAT